MTMTIPELSCGIALIVISIFIVAITLGQTTKQQGMTSAVGGGNNSDSFYGKHGGNTKEKALENLTRIMAVLFFLIIIGVNIVEALGNK